MKTGLWVVIVLVTGIVGFLVGYSVSSYTGNRRLDAPHATETAKAAPAPAAAAKHTASAGYGGSAPAAAPASAGYGAPAPAAPAAKPPVKPAAAGY
jgi:hypothetical protein